MSQSRVTGGSGVYAIESPLYKWLPQTGFSRSRVLSSLNDNHHHSTHPIANTLHLSYHLHPRSLLTTLIHGNLLAVLGLRQLSLRTTRPPSPLPLSTFARGIIFDQPCDHESLKGAAFYFHRGVDYLHFLQVTEAPQSFVLSFPALFRPLSTEIAVGKLGQHQLHYDRQLETNPALVGRWGGAR